nr:MAG TPA: ECF sigma factor [Caudoviricetes sp.]
MAALCKSGHTMDTQHKAIRGLLSSMAPTRAEEAVRLVGLPPDEEAAVLAVDVHGQSCLQAAALLHVSVDGLAKIRRRAYAKLADEIRG